MASENGWEPSRLDPNSPELVWIRVPGTNVSLQIMKGDPLIILPAFAADINAFVETLRDNDSACYTPTNSVNTSNHLNATGMDLNWDSHPFHAFGTYNAAQMATLAELFEFYSIDGVYLIAWGGKDWDGNPQDEMHYQMGYNTWNNPKVREFIRNKIRADGFSTFRRGGVPAAIPIPPSISNRDRYILATIAEGQRLGISPRGIKIAISVELVETNLTMYANSNDPPSLDIWHEKVGSDHMSSGLYQQQTSWGTLERRMEPTYSTNIFFMVDNGPGVRGLTKIRDGNGNLYDYNDESHSPGFFAQKVQGSAYPDRYDERFVEASNLYDQFATSTPDSEEFLMGLAQDEQVEIRDKIRQLHGATFTPNPSKSRYADPKELWATKDFIRNDDGFLYDLITEHDAALGDPTALAKIKKAASEGDDLAQHFLDQISNVAVNIPNPVGPVDNNLTCWNCGKHYPSTLFNCPFCGAPQIKPEVVVPVPVPEPADIVNDLPAVGQNVINELNLLQRFGGELPPELASAVNHLIPILKGFVK